MKLFNLIFRRMQRLERPRKRPGRSLAMSYASLESRALLTVIGPIALPAASATIATFTNTLTTFTSTATLTSTSQPFTSTAPFTSTSQPSTGLSLTSSSLLNFGPSSPGGNKDRPTDEPGAQGSPAQPYDRLNNHVALSEAGVTVDGVTNSEFALADAGISEVLVRYGNEVLMLGPSQGIDQPQSVELAFLNNDGTTDASDPYPDLIVTNSGGNNILVFPGLPGDEFGPALNGVAGFSVGQDPVSVTVADVNNDGVPDLLVANQGSNNVSILQGQESSGNWISNSVQTIPVGDQATDTAPIKVLYKDYNNDGLGDLFVANSGSDNVYVYQGLGNGAFNTTDPTIFEVGNDPQDMLVGQFDRRPQLDLVTVNSGSDNLTLIDGVLTSTPTTQTISSGGATPDAAFAFDGENGMMDLIVANSGDGRLAFLQAGNSGLQIAGVVSPSNLPDPTSLIPGSSEGDEINFLAATAGEDAAELLSFDLGISSTYLPMPVSGSSGVNGTDSELIAGLMPFGESSLELIAVFWVGSSDQSGLSNAFSLREPSSITALYSPTEGQGSTSTSTTDVTGDAHEPQEIPEESDEDSPPSVNSFITGTGRKITASQPPIDDLALRDRVLTDPEASVDQFARFSLSSIEATGDSDDQAHEGTVEQAIRLPSEMDEDHSNLKEGHPSTDPPARLEPARPAESRDTSALEGQFETIPLISSVVLLSTRLILKASPPRPPSFRKGAGFRISPGKPEAGPPI
jgi:hypothetical protein